MCSVARLVCLQNCIVMKQRRISATYMRGGTSKGIFFRRSDLPENRAERDRVLLRALGSPDPYRQQMDGMGGATSSTSKVVVVWPSSTPGCDVEYDFGQVAVDKPVIDWSGNCGNLTSAVGPFAIAQGMLETPPDGVVCVRLRNCGLDARIDAYVPMSGGEVVEDGEFELDGVAFPGAEIRLEFLDPGLGASGSDGVFPTGLRIERLDVPGIGSYDATMMTAGNPTVFVLARQLGLQGDESPTGINADAAMLAKLEAIRVCAAVRMGMACNVEEAGEVCLHTPKICFVGMPSTFVAASGRVVKATEIDLNARIVSMGKLHHAMTGTGAIALGVAAATPGTLVSQLLGGTQSSIRFGHASGSMSVGAEAEESAGTWRVTKVLLSRSARRLMEGSVFVPADVFAEHERGRD
jgi:probable AcnD-accessory protein PrpF